MYDVGYGRVDTRSKTPIAGTSVFTGVDSTSSSSLSVCLPLSVQRQSFSFSRFFRWFSNYCNSDDSNGFKVHFKSRRKRDREKGCSDLGGKQWGNTTTVTGFDGVEEGCQQKQKGNRQHRRAEDDVIQDYFWRVPTSSRRKVLNWYDYGWEDRLLKSRERQQQRYHSSLGRNDRVVYGEGSEVGYFDLPLQKQRHERRVFGLSSLDTETQHPRSSLRDHFQSENYQNRWIVSSLEEETPTPARKKIYRNGQKSKMRTVSRDDYLMARGANPRTGLVTPSSHSEASPFDNESDVFLRQRPDRPGGSGLGANAASKWRLKGDQWISLGLDEPTPIPSPPAELKNSLESRHAGKPLPSRLGAMQHQSRNVSTMPGGFESPAPPRPVANSQSPKTMSQKQMDEFQQSVDRVKRHSQINSRGGGIPNQESIIVSREIKPKENPYDTPPRQSSQDRDQEQNSPGRKITRKAIGTPIKSSPSIPQKDDVRIVSNETVITKSNLQDEEDRNRSSSAPAPKHEYYNADEMGRDLSDRHQPRNDGHQHVPNSLLGLKKGDWIEDVPAEILDMSKKSSEIRLHSSPPMNSGQPRFPPSNRPIHPNAPRMPPRPMMKKAFGMPPRGRGVVTEMMPHIPNSRSWTQPYRYPPSNQPQLIHRPATTGINDSYVVLHPSDQRHQGSFPHSQAGMVKDMRRRMEMRNPEYRNCSPERSSPEKVQPQSHIPTSTSIPTMSTGMMDSKQDRQGPVLDDSLFMPRVRPRAMSRPALPPRTDGSISVPQVSPYKREGNETFATKTVESPSTDRSKIQNEKVDKTKMEEERVDDGDIVSRIAKPMDMTIKNTSPDRTTRQTNDRNHQDHSLHQQMGLRSLDPRIGQFILSSSQDTSSSSQGLGMDGIILMREGQSKMISGQSKMNPDQSKMISGQSRMLPGQFPINGGATTTTNIGHESLTDNPIIGFDLSSTSDSNFKHHERCCPTCCAIGCHGSCLGHASPPPPRSPLPRRNVVELTKNTTGGITFGFRNALRNSLRFRKPPTPQHHHHHQQRQINPRGGRQVKPEDRLIFFDEEEEKEGEEDEEEEEEITIAELESPSLPWETESPISLLPSSYSGIQSFWSSSSSSSKSKPSSSSSSQYNITTTILNLLST